MTRGTKNKHTLDGKFTLKISQKKHKAPGTRIATLAIRVITFFDLTAKTRDPMIARNEGFGLRGACEDLEASTLAINTRPLSLTKDIFIFSSFLV
ncbi:hypothetical protein Tco_0481958 [Tanacetum coccineum]